MPINLNEEGSHEDDHKLENHEEHETPTKCTTCSNIGDGRENHVSNLRAPNSRTDKRDGMNRRGVQIHQIV